MRRQIRFHHRGELLFHLKENREKSADPLKDQRNKSTFHFEVRPQSGEINGPKATLSNAGWVTICEMWYLHRTVIQQVLKQQWAQRCH